MADRRSGSVNIESTVTWRYRPGNSRAIDEIIFTFAHHLEMDRMLPGIPPTGRRVKVPMVVVVQLRADEIVCERIYWGQASVLVQIGLLDPMHLLVAGMDSARKVLDPSLLSNQLIRRARDDRV